MRKLENKKAIITGGRRGIGRAIALAYVKEGAAIVINYQSKEDEAKKVVEEITQLGGKAIAIKADVSKNEDRAFLVNESKKFLGGIDILVNNAGIYFQTDYMEITETDVHVIIYEPNGAPEKIAHNREIPVMTPGRAALVELINHYLNGLLDPFVTLLEVHKLMYFMQAAGEPLKLKYQKAIYGPYAENLRHVLNKIEGHLITGYADGGDNPEKQLKLVPGTTENAARFLEQHPDTRDRFNKVAELVEGFETPFGLELLSTAHWVITQDNAQSVEDVIQYIYAWNERKRQFTPRQITLAVDVLSKKGWVEGAMDLELKKNES